MIFSFFPLLTFSLGGSKGSGSTVQVEKLLHHPDGVAGAQTAHDDKREQPALPTTRRPGLWELRMIVLFHYHYNTSLEAYTQNTCIHATKLFTLTLALNFKLHFHHGIKLSTPNFSLRSLPLDREGCAGEPDLPTQHSVQQTCILNSTEILMFNLSVNMFKCTV